MNAAARNLYAPVWLAVALLAALAGCIKIEDKDAPKGGDGKGGDGASWVDDLNLGSGNLAFDGDAVVLKRGSTTARIAANGDLTIDGKDVPVDAEQRAELVAYHGAARQLRSNALATGRAGAQLAKDVVADVLSGIAQGDTSEIKRNAELKAQNVKRAAGRICDDLGTMRAAQDRLAGSLDAFKPFATIDAATLDDCRVETAPDPALATASPDAPNSAGPTTEVPAAPTDATAPAASSDAPAATR
jgi:hypothetical protein